jgi:hypothetical protein
MKRCLSLTLATITGFAAPLGASETVVDGSSYPNLFGPPDDVTVVPAPIPPNTPLDVQLGGTASGALGTHWTAQATGGAVLGSNLLDLELRLAETGAQVELADSALRFDLSNSPGAILSELGVGLGLSLTWSATATFDAAGSELALTPNTVYRVSFDIDSGSGLLNSTLGISPTFGVELLDGGGVPVGYVGGGTLANIIGLDQVEVVGAPEGTGRVTAQFVTGSSVSTAAAGLRFTGSAVLPASLGDVGANFATVSNLTVVEVDPYTVWVEENEVDESMQDPNADPDSDGKPNIQEYALATDPNSGGHDDVDYAIGDPDGGGPQTSAFVMTIPVRAGAEFSSDGGDQIATQDGATYRVEGSYELMTWNLAISEVTASQPFVSNLPSLPAGWEYRSFRLPDQTPSTPRGFLRVKFD